MALCLASEQQRRVRVFLTAIGGGAFGNRHGWIADAIRDALIALRDAPLDVILVHYGTQVKSEWAAISTPLSGPTPGDGSRGSDAVGHVRQGTSSL